MNLIVKEEDVLESLELISQRLGYEAPSAAWSNFSARQQQSLQQQLQQEEAGWYPNQNSQSSPVAGSVHLSSSSAGREQRRADGQTGGLDSCGPNSKITQHSTPGSGCRSSAVNGRPDTGNNGLVSAWRVGGYWLPPDHPLASVETRLRRGGACDVCRCALSPLPVLPLSN